MLISQKKKKKIDSESVYNKKFFKTKIKFHGDEVTEFYDEEIRKLDSNHTCLAEVSLDSALNKDRNYYLQVFSKACKYIKKKIIRHSMNHLEGSSNYSDDSDNSNKE